VPGLYVSDADVEVAKDIESLRLDRHLVEHLASMLGSKRRRMIDRVEEYAHKNPLAVLPILLKHYESNDPKIRGPVRASVERITQSQAGEAALVECLFSRNPGVRTPAAHILESRGYNSLNFLNVYEQAKGLILEARRAEVYTEDVEELLLDSVATYKEGRFEQAIRNVGIALELIEDRYQRHKQLKGYVQDVLRLTPALARSGVQIDAIQDSIRRVIPAMKEREHEEARELLEARRREARIWKQLWSLMEFISKRVTKRPLVELMVLRADDEWLLSQFRSVAKRTAGLEGKGETGAALGTVEEFLRDDFSATYLATAKARLAQKDEAVWYTLWSVGLASLKLLAPLLPHVAEEFYQQYYRDREGSPSIHTVAWPEPFKELAAAVPTPAAPAARAASASAAPATPVRGAGEPPARPKPAKR